MGSSFSAAGPRWEPRTVSRRESTAAHSLELIWAREAEWKRRLELVECAQHRIAVSTYYFQWDDYGRRFLEALHQARRCGVQVYFLLDGFGQRISSNLMTHRETAASESAFRDLAKDGVVFHRYWAQRAWQRAVGYGHHVKMQLCDDRVGLLTSGNLSRMSFEAWNELAVELHGPAVDLLACCFSALMPSYPGPSVSGRPADPGVPMEFWYDNPCERTSGDSPNVITAELVRRIDAARTSVALTSFFFKPTRTLLEAVLRARRRGVRVAVHHSAPEALGVSDIPWLPSGAVYGQILAGGISLHEHPDGEHSKVIAIDGTWAMAGTYNFEHAAHERLAEAMIASEAPGWVQPLSDRLAALEQHPSARMLTQEALRDWGWKRRLRLGVYRPLQRFL